MSDILGIHEKTCKLAWNYTEICKCLTKLSVNYKDIIINTVTNRQETWRTNKKYHKIIRIKQRDLCWFCNKKWILTIICENCSFVW